MAAYDFALQGFQASSAILSTQFSWSITEMLSMVDNGWTCFTQGFSLGQINLSAFFSITIGMELVDVGKIKFDYTKSFNCIM